MKFMLGTKEYMTQVFDDKGRVQAGTVISAPPLTVSQIKTAFSEGYVAVQVASGPQKESRLSKAERGHTKGLGFFKNLKEFRAEEEPAYKRGDIVEVSIFSPGEKVEVRGVSKGKGFQGAVKRHGFKGGSRTHGQSHSEREPGSIGGGLRTRVPKGMRMPGRMGGEVILVRNLTVLHVDPQGHRIIVSGAVPGRRGTLLEIISR